MSNILINPNSGILEFNTGIAGQSIFDNSSTGVARLQFSNGALSIGPYNTNTFVVKDTRVGIGTGIPSYLLDVNGTGYFRGPLYSNGVSVLTGVNTGSFITSGQTGSFLTTSSKVVYTTGNQTVSGEKNFPDTIEFSNANSMFKCNGGIASNGLQLYKIGNYYSFRAGATGYWGDGSTQVTLGTLGEPGFTAFDYVNGGTFQIGYSFTAGQYNGSTIRMGPDGIGIWGNDGGDITITNGGVSINSNGGTPYYSLDVAGSIKGNEYYSSAGNSGITDSVTFYDPNASMNRTLNFENGLLVSIT